MEPQPAILRSSLGFQKCWKSSIFVQRFIITFKSASSARRPKKVLEQLTGNVYEPGHRWIQHKEAHNRHVYAILPTS